MKPKLPQTISSKDLMGFATLKPDIFHMRIAYQVHLEEFHKIKASSQIMSFFALATAVEIYLKIHFTVYAWTQKNNFEKLDIQNWCYMLGEKPVDKVGINARRSFGHNIPRLLIAIKHQLHLNEEQLKTISLAFNIFGHDWAVFRYDPKSIQAKERLQSAYIAFLNLRTYLTENKLDIINQIQP